jgi:hypothetical protein
MDRSPAAKLLTVGAIGAALIATMIWKRVRSPNTNTNANTLPLQSSSGQPTITTVGIMPSVTRRLSIVDC